MSFDSAIPLVYGNRLLNIDSTQSGVASGVILLSIGSKAVYMRRQRFRRSCSSRGSIDVSNMILNRPI